MLKNYIISKCCYRYCNVGIKNIRSIGLSSISSTTKTSSSSPSSSSSSSNSSSNSYYSIKSFNEEDTILFQQVYHPTVLRYIIILIILFITI